MENYLVTAKIDGKIVEAKAVTVDAAKVKIMTSHPNKVLMDIHSTQIRSYVKPLDQR